MTRHMQWVWGVVAWAFSRIHPPDPLSRAQQAKGCWACTGPASDSEITYTFAPIHFLVFGFPPLDLWRRTPRCEWTSIMADAQQTHKEHHATKVKERREAKANVKKQRGNDPRAFISANPRSAQKQILRNAQREQGRLHVPQIHRGPSINPAPAGPGSAKARAEAGEVEPPPPPPPVIVAVVGPEGVGKSTLVRSLVRRYTKHTVAHIQGPVTVVSGKHRRITIIECPNTVDAMIDASKVADLVLLMIDGSFGFEMVRLNRLNLLCIEDLPLTLAACRKRWSFSISCSRTDFRKSSVS